MIQHSRSRAFLAWFFVVIYFGMAVAATWTYFLNPDALYGQNVDAFILRAGAVGLVLPILVALLADKERLGRHARIVLKTVPSLGLLLLVAANGFAFGLASGNHFGFVIGDTYRLLTLPLGLLAGLAMPLRPLMRAMLILSIANAGLFALGMAYVSLYPISFVGFGTFHLLIPLCVLTVFEHGTPKWRLATVLLSAVAVILGLKRAVIGVFPVLLLAVAWRDKAARWAAVILILALSGGFAYFGEKSEALAPLYDRVSATYEDGNVDTSTSSRFQEVRSSWNYMNKNAPLGALQVALAGMGSGATYLLDNDDLRLNTIDDDSSEVHNIHFTPMTLVFRHGFFGAAVTLFGYLACIAAVMRIAMKLRKDSFEGRAAFAIALFGFVLLVNSLSGFTIVGDLLFPLCVGALLRAVEPAAGAQPAASAPGAGAPQLDPIS